MDKLTDSAQGYCEMYCKKYGHCFGDPGDCIFQDEVKMYESLKNYECTGMSPGDIKTMAISALQEQAERQWIPVTDRLPENWQKVVFFNYGADAVYAGKFNYIGKRGTVWFRAGKTSYPGSHWMPLPEPPKEDDYGNWI